MVRALFYKQVVIVMLDGKVVRAMLGNKVGGVILGKQVICLVICTIKTSCSRLLPRLCFVRLMNASDFILSDGWFYHEYSNLYCG